MKHIFKSLLLAAAVLALAACAKEETGSHGGEDTAGPVIVNASSAAIDGEIILKFKNEASGIVEKTRAAGAVPAGSGIDEIDRVLTSVGTVRFERLSRRVDASRNAPARKGCICGIMHNTTRPSQRPRWPECFRPARTSPSSSTRCRP